MLAGMLEQGRMPRPVARPAEWTFHPPRLPFGITFPSPRAASVAVLGMVAFGVILGSTVSPTWQSLPAASPLLLAVRPHASPLAEVTGGSAGAGAGETGGSAAGGGGAGGGTITVTVTQSAPAPVTGASAIQPLATGGSFTPPKTGAGGSSTPNQFGLPPVHHVFLIMLSDEGLGQTFGPGSQDTYLSKTLPARGELIYNYYAVAGSELANEIALISGQGPNRQTIADCPAFTPVSPGTIAKRRGEVIGNGCVYPTATATLPGELAAKGLTWKAYIGAMDLGPPGQATSCRHPTVGAKDPDHVPRAGDSYVTWLNPFVYFNSLIKNKTCTKDDVGPEGLESDLQNPAKAPAFAYIAPSPCDDGSTQPCTPDAPAGLPPADSFLKTVIPEIEQSAAYKDHGLIAITFDQAPQSGADVDSSACCEFPTYPNLARDSRAAADPTSTTNTTPATTTPTATTPASTTPTTTTPASTTPTTAAPPTPFGGSTGQTRATGGGGRVGLLLISRYVQKGSIDAVDYYNHYSLLATLEDMFGLKTLGYAAERSLPILDSAVFNGP
jgi:phosphatidylinositol-3-phosphatase